ncbi:TPA: hypothetical protein DF272_00215 [Candidatus Falkowbacteria bacterium]|nr:hypothetical protein [Candidatus Falkowbacteria bacterium]
MRILVIEDNEAHRQSAEETLRGHEVTIVESFDEAMELMDRKIDERNVQRLLSEAGVATAPKYTDRESWTAYRKVLDDANSRSVIPFPFEVVLTDMMMPMSSQTLAPEVFNHRERVPYGFVIALRAALRGARFVAMVTDTNHHQGAMSAAIDHLGDTYYRDGFKPNFTVNGARVMFVHTPFYREVLGKKTCSSCGGSGACKHCKGTGQRNDQYVQGECNACPDDVGKCSECKGSGHVDDVRQTRKDWGRVLADLTA